MSTALEAASLVMVPSGYEDGSLASVKPTDGTGDFTFSRGSDISATRVNEDGYIEKGYENLLLQSNSFLTTWLQTDLTATSGESGYDGSSDAWLLSKSAANGRLRQYVTDTGVQTLSAYFKAGTNNWMRITYGGATTYFDLANGVLGSDNSINATITSVGSGWYRCTFTANVTSAQYAQFYVADSNGDTSATSGSIYIQDAMLNQGMVSYPYVETTTAPVAGGILEDMPRLDYTDSSCPSLKLEPQRTNLIEYSEYLGSNWTFIRTNYESNTATSPEGLTNAAKVFANTSSGNHYFEKVGFTGFTSGDYTYSFFAKSAGSDFVQIATSTGFDSRYQNFNLTTGEKASGDTDSSGYDTSITPIGDDGWYRLTITANAPSTSVRFLIIPILTDAARNPVFTGDGVNGFYFYGAQLEQDATYPTSYIPTYGTSQTRLAEDLELPTLSSVFDSTGSFTLFFEIERLSSSVQQQILYIRGQGYFRLDATADNRLKFVIYGGGASVTEANSDINTFVAGTSSKIIYKQNGTIGQCFINGQEISSGTPTILTGFFTFYQRNENHIKHKEVYFPTALSDDECIELTTI